MKEKGKETERAEEKEKVNQEGKEEKGKGNV